MEMAQTGCIVRTRTPHQGALQASGDRARVPDCLEFTLRPRTIVDLMLSWPVGARWKRADAGETRKHRGDTLSSKRTTSGWPPSRRSGQRRSRLSIMLRRN